ncbi:FMN-binding protein [Paenibacillus piri]|nr:FMN-binding protein [Paenibacillus piri]
MNNKWVVLCAAAIGAIYTAGYLATESQASVQQPAPISQAGIQADSSPSKGQYKNGTFNGTGSNRRGSIQAAVTIKNDKITDVEISHFAMHYSEDDVVGLPQEVVQKQSAQVRNVSGATYSTRAFQDAVQDALSKARNT